MTGVSGSPEEGATRRRTHGILQDFQIQLEHIGHPGREVINVLAWRSFIEKRS